MNILFFDVVRLRAARVLLVGLSGLGAEVAKNIILSGIKSITLLDHANVTEEDRCCQFLVSRDDVGKNVIIFKYIHLVPLTTSKKMHKKLPVKSGCSL